MNCQTTRRKRDWAWITHGLFFFFSGLLMLNVSASPLDDLLFELRQARLVEKQKNTERIQKFTQQHHQQQQLLSQAKAELAARQTQQDALREQVERTALELAQRKQQLEQQSQALADLFATARQTAGDTHHALRNSLTLAQFSSRSAALEPLLEQEQLPSLEQLRTLWLALLEEMVACANVVRFQAPLIHPNGVEQPAEVVRVGGFSAVSSGQFLRWLPGSQRLVVLSQQPAPRLQALAQALQQSTDGWHLMAVDPSQGEMFSLMTQSLDWQEQIALGGMIGYLILGVGGLGMLLVLERTIALNRLQWKIRKQRKQLDHPSPHNPLGRILSIATERSDASPEILELKLDEAILRELPQLKRGLSSIGVLAAVSPLLGLLGTVTGIIHTFQMITVMGSHDPKLLSSGISEALVTTELGLIAAIALLLPHTLLMGMSQRLVHQLDEQSAALVARQAEKHVGA